MAGAFRRWRLRKFDPNPWQGTAFKTASGSVYKIDEHGIVTDNYRKIYGKAKHVSSIPAEAEDIPLLERNRLRGEAFKYDTGHVDTALIPYMLKNRRPPDKGRRLFIILDKDGEPTQHALVTSVLKEAPRKR